MYPRFKHYPEVQEENYNAFLGTPNINQRRVQVLLPSAITNAASVKTKKRS